ncbi:hypothetical protein BYT27DRAFT_7228392 [Phlegmacium glaucopus]|nr:hypothetical protein BYT27DRAFT_7228392 [Phlegmacium glaucopus]
MPDYLQKDLLDKIELIFPNQLKNTDTKAEGINNIFPTWLFGDEAPTYADPSTINCQGLKKINTSQLIPTTSNELKENCEEYTLLKDALQPIFEWQADVLRKVLPEEFKILSQFAETLPSSGNLPVYPFGGFILNINISTRIHRDWKDLRICLVMVFSDCEDGDLVFMEPGIVFSLNNGDIIIFPSSKISHFKLHFKGRRVSLVLHSDNEVQKWVETRNGWKGNSFFSSTDTQD